MRAPVNRTQHAQPLAWRHGVAAAALGLFSTSLLLGCAGLPPPLPAWQGDPAAAAVTGDDLIIVAVADTPQPRPSPGSAPRGGYRPQRRLRGQ